MKEKGNKKSFLWKVRVKASARRDAIVQKTKDSFVVSVDAHTKGGEANRRVLELLRRHLGADVDIRIVHGHHSPSKIVSVQVRE